jgi:hypothetical protein
MCRWRALFVASVLGASGCFLFPELDGLDDRHGLDAGNLLDVGGADALESPPLEGGGGCPGFFCDDFEGAFRWDRFRVRSPSAASIVTEPTTGVTPTSGRAMLRIVTTAAADAYANVERAMPPRSSGVVALRARLYLTSAPAPRTTLLGFLARDATSDYASLLRLRTTDDGRWLVTTTHSGVATDRDGAARISAGAWLCVEMVASLGSAGHVGVYVDGTQVIDADVQTTAGAPYNAMLAGVFSTNGTIAQEIFVDDVVTASFDDDDARRARIGCAAP